MSAKDHGETPLFQGLTPEQIEELSSWLVRMEFVPGQEIVTEGSEPDGLYIVARGSVEVLKNAPAGPTRIAELSAPCVFGEMALLNREPRSACVRAVTRVTAGFLSQQVYEQRVGEDNATALHISLNLGKVACQRLRATTEKMLRLAEGSGAGEPSAAPARKPQPELKTICTRFLKGDAS